MNQLQSLLSTSKDLTNKIEIMLKTPKYVSIEEETFYNPEVMGYKIIFSEEKHNKSTLINKLEIVLKKNVKKLEQLKKKGYVSLGVFYNNLLEENFFDEEIERNSEIIVLGKQPSSKLKEKNELEIKEKYANTKKIVYSKMTNYYLQIFAVNKLLNKEKVYLKDIFEYYEESEDLIFLEKNKRKPIKESRKFISDLRELFYKTPLTIRLFYEKDGKKYLKLMSVNKQTILNN